MNTIKYTVFLLLLLFLACKNNVEQAASVEDKIDKRTLVKVANIEETQTDFPIYGIGKVGSDTEVQLSFKIGGIIASINAKEGSYVKKGQLLATLRTQEIDAQVLKAKQAVDKAQRDLQRITAMFADSAATSENVEDLTTALEVAKADLNIATFNQQYARIISPVSGRVIQKMAEPNELISPGMPVFSIASSTAGGQVLQVGLSDRDIDRVKVGNRASITFDAFSNRTFDGKVTLISESANPRTGTFTVEVKINAGDTRLRNGYIGRVSLFPDQNEKLLALPIAALVEGNTDNVKIFVPNQNGTVKEVTVKPVDIRSDYFLVQQPTFEITQVITDGATYLSDGDAIRIAQ